MVQEIDNQLLNIEVCPICAGKAQIVVTNSPYRIVQCKSCRFIYRSPKPKTDEVYEYYSSAQTSTHNVDRKLRQVQATQRLQRLCRKIDFNALGSVLEVGCDDGLFLHTVNERFPNIELFGIEPSQKRAESGRCLYSLQNVVATPFEKTNFNRTFDLIVAFHVLEHVTDPVKFLEKIRPLMKPDSFFCLEVPTVSLSRLDLPFGIKILAHGYTQSPEHLWLFVPETFRNLLERCGFQIVFMKCVTFGVHPTVNSFVMGCMPWLFPLYGLMSDGILLPFNVTGNGLQVMAIVSRTDE